MQPVVCAASSPVPCPSAQPQRAVLLQPRQRRSVATRGGGAAVRRRVTWRGTKREVDVPGIRLAADELMPSPG